MDPEARAAPTCDDALAAGVVGDKLAEVVAGDGQRARLAPGLQQLHQDAQDLEVLLLEVPYVLPPELLLQQAGSIVEGSTGPWYSTQLADIPCSRLGHKQCRPCTRALESMLSQGGSKGVAIT